MAGPTVSSSLLEADGFCLLALRALDAGGADEKDRIDAAAGGLVRPPEL